jgi:hypothetical protein
VQTSLEALIACSDPAPRSRTLLPNLSGDLVRGMHGIIKPGDRAMVEELAARAITGL